MTAETELSDPPNVSVSTTRQTNSVLPIQKTEKTDTNCLIDVQSVVNPPPPPSLPDTTSVSLRPGGYLLSHMCVRGPGPHAVRSAFHGRQHKVIRWRPSAGGAPRSLSCPHSSSVSRCPALTSRQGGTAVRSGQTSPLSTLTHSKLKSYIWKLLLTFWEIHLFAVG